MYSPENRRAAFAFIDRFSGMPVRTTLDPIAYSTNPGDTELMSANRPWDGDDITLTATEPPVDCLAGERERARRTDQFYPELDK